MLASIQRVRDNGGSQASGRAEGIIEGIIEGEESRQKSANISYSRTKKEQ